ncbi:MAG TPA: transcription/translation regulatory transformer protein RfaH [Gammaproteobacteria bacterium]|nr:transcription/translation regulatory transformer protein RfaH [Gammaproteobacteria bacterium]
MQEKWYVIHTKPRQEARAEENLNAQGYEVYVPQIKIAKRRRGKWVDVVEPLFPRYAFIHLTAYEDNFAPIRSTLGVSRLLRFGETPAVVPDSLIESLRAGEALSGGGFLESSRIFPKGAEVAIVDGPLAGIKGIVQCDSGKERVVLLLNMLGRETPTKVSRDDIVPVS